MFFFCMYVDVVACDCVIIWQEFCEMWDVYCDYVFNLCCFGLRVGYLMKTAYN